MKECEKALNGLPLRKECDYPSAQVAEEMGFRAGWKQALELVLKWSDYHKQMDALGWNVPFRDRIKKELEEK